jgi:hypothetical protein
MLLGLPTICFRVQHDILLRNPLEMSYYLVPTGHKSLDKTIQPIPIHRNLI